MADEPARTLLNVNDDDATRYAITRILQRAGFRVREAVNGKDALLQAADLPDLIILDIRLPDIDGFEVCRRLKADSATVAIPLLHLSASFVGSQDKARGLDSGADAYLTQPVEPEELISTVRALLRMQKAESERAIAVRGLQESEQRFRLAISALVEGLVIFDAAGIIRECNPSAERILSRTADEIIGGTSLDDDRRAIHEDGTPFDRDAFPHTIALRTGVRQSDVIMGLPKQAGEPTWISVNAAPLLHPGADTPYGAVVTFADVTERRWASAENARLQQEALHTAEVQRTFLREVLASVTEARLRLCDTSNDLPAPLPLQGEPIFLAKQTLRSVRRRTEEAAGAQGFSEERTQDLITAVAEATMNAVVHGGGGEARVATDNAGTVQVWIQDKGKGIGLDYLHRATLERGYTTAGSMGHGFWLMLKTADRIWLLTGPKGTTIVLEQDRTAPDPSWWGIVEADA